MANKPKRRWFQFHLSSMVAVTAVCSMIIAANIPKEKHYIETIYPDGSSTLSPSSQNYNVGIVNCGWPMVIYGNYRSNDDKVRNWYIKFSFLSLVANIGFCIAACYLAARFTEHLLYPKIPKCLPIPGLEPVFDESKEQ